MHSFGISFLKPGQQWGAYVSNSEVDYAAIGTFSTAYIFVLCEGTSKPCIDTFKD